MGILPVQKRLHALALYTKFYYGLNCIITKYCNSFMKKQKHVFISGLLTGTALLFAGGFNVANAQVNNPTADPSRIRDQQSITIPESDTELQKSYSEPTSPAQINAPQGAAKFEFVLNELQISGVTAYPPNAFDYLYKDLQGQKITVEKLYDIANQITKKYHEDGFIFSRALIPEQEIEDGSAKISVAEGYIHDVHVQNDLPDSYLVDGIIEAVKKSRPLNIRDLERAMLLMDRLPGQKAQAVLEPVKRESANAGEIDLNIIIRKKDPQFFASVDNYGSCYIGPWQAGSVAVLPHDFLYKGETTLSIYAAQPLKELKYGAISEKIPLTSDGLTLRASAQANASEPGSRLKSLELKNKFRSFKLELKYPLVLTRSEKISPYLSFESNDSQSDILGTRLYHDRLSVLRLGLNHQFADSLLGKNTYDIILSKGLNILGVRDTGSADLSRAEGHSDFTKVNFEASRTQGLGNVPFSLKLGVAGQYAFSELLSSEEMGYGGPMFGRAYDNSEITGDSGIKTSIELAHDPFMVAKHVIMQPFMFYDFAKLWNLDTNSKPLTGSSAGLGVRTLLWDKVSLTTTLSQPLTRSQSNPLYGNGKNPRFMVSLQYEF